MALGQERAAIIEALAMLLFATPSHNAWAQVPPPEWQLNVMAPGFGGATSFVSSHSAGSSAATSSSCSMVRLRRDVGVEGVGDPRAVLAWLTC